MIEERSIIKCLLGSAPLPVIDPMNQEELFEFFKDSYFHFWKSSLLQSEDGLSVLKTLYLRYIKENELEDLENERKWLLLHLITCRIIGGNFSFHLLIENIDNTLEEIEDGDIVKLEEDVNLIAKILIEVDAVNYVLRYSKFKEFGVEPSVEADVLPSFIRDHVIIKNILKQNYPISAFATNFLDLEIGEFDLTHLSEKEIYNFYTDILIFKSIGLVMALLQDMRDENLDEAMVDFDQMEAFADFAIESVLSDLFSDQETLMDDAKEGISDLLIEAILEDLLVDE